MKNKISDTSKDIRIPFEFTRETVDEKYKAFVVVSRSEDDPEEDESKRKKSGIFSDKILKNILKRVGIAAAFLLCVAVCAVFFTSFINAYIYCNDSVVGDSMLPTLSDGQKIHESYIPYIFGEPEIGDIVILDADFDCKINFFTKMKSGFEGTVFGTWFIGNDDYREHPEKLKEYYVKRVVAVAGDLVEFRDGIFYRNGEPVSEDFIFEQDVYSYPADFSETVEEGKVFVMGDNRNNSNDSRNFGQVPIDHITGKVAKK